MELVYLYSYKRVNESSMMEKNLFVKYVGLPDLAIWSETPFMRHRSISSHFETLPNDFTLKESIKYEY